MLKAAFLLSMATTIGLTAMNFLGYDVLNYVIGMMVVSFLSLGGYMEIENKKILKETKEFMGTKLEGIEKICGETLAHLRSANPEAKLERHKSDVNYILDNISRRSLDLEERLNAFGRILSRHMGIAPVDDSEPEAKTKETKDDKPCEIVPEISSGQEQMQETYNVGEIIYIDDDEEKSLETY